MNGRFEVVFLADAIGFLDKLDNKARKKIYYNIDKAKFLHDPKLFKKLTSDIWEFRTEYDGVQYRLFAFWDKTEKERPWSYQHMGLSKREIKYRDPTLTNKQITNGIFQEC